MAPERAVKNTGLRSARARALALPRVGAIRWLPPLLLALATVTAIVAAYSVRPFVSIELGNYYDSAYLPNTPDRDADSPDFHAREVGPIGPEEVTPWPATQQALELPGRRAGIWQATIEIAEGQPDDQFKLSTLAVNDVRVGVTRRDAHSFVAVIPPELAAADRLTLRLDPALVGDPAPPAGLAKEVRLAPARTFRWSSDRSTISLPQLGRGDWTVALAAIVQHPDGTPLDATVAANGVTVARLPEGGPRRIAFLVPAALAPDGDLTLSINAKTYSSAGEQRALGVLLYSLQVAPAGPRALMPPIGSLLAALALALCLYACLLRLTGRQILAAALALIVVLSGAWALAAARYPMAFMLPRLALLAIWSLALLLALERLLPWVFRKSGVPLSGWLLAALLLTFFVGYWIKTGGMLYPYFVAKDVAWHMDRVRTIADGNLSIFYGTNSPLNESTMPTAEWGSNRPVIPYSPWFHMFATSLLLLPLPLVLAANLFSALVDCSRVFLIGLLARKSGLSERAALLAALLYAVTPATFLLHSWGNIPTTFGMWWTLLSTTFIVVAYGRLDRPWPFALTLLLTATMLFYTVMAVFMVLFLALLVPALWLVDRAVKVETFEGSNVQTSPPAVARRTSDRRSIAAIALATIAAIGLSTLIYYGQYIPLILERTVPYFLQAATPGDTNVGIQQRQSFLSYLAAYWPRLGYFERPVAYGLQLTVLLAAVGIFAVRSRRARALLLCWAAVAALFMVAGNRISMVDKQVFYLMPALALVVGALLDRLWRRGAPARLVVISSYAFALIAALDLWLFRIVSTR